MAKSLPPEKRKQSHLEEVLDFCENLSRSMILSGANLERVQLAVERICHTYALQDVSLYLLSGFLSLSAHDAEGRYACRQGSIPPAGIQLQKLKQLNRLSYTVAATRPAPERLSALLAEAERVKPYPDWAVLLFQLCAAGCLCFLFGGTWRELLPIVVSLTAVHYAGLLLARPGLDRIVSNAVTMFLAAVIALAFIGGGFTRSGPVVLIVISLLMIPGIPLVNAVRNLLCGNEMNGILQLAKVTVETVALGLGIYLALRIFGMREGMSAAVVSGTSEALLLVVLSFLASVCFGAVFGIPPHDLWRAGLGGALTRVAILCLTPLFPTRLVSVTLSALVAALYAEFWATKRRDPSTYFVYPAIIPLIPGDLFYYSLVGLYQGDRAMFEGNGINCLLSLFGMSLGFVLSSIIAHYVRKMRHLRRVKKS